MKLENEVLRMKLILIKLFEKVTIVFVSGLTVLSYKKILDSYEHVAWTMRHNIINVFAPKIAFAHTSCVNQD